MSKSENFYSRRDVVKGFGVVAGAVGINACSGAAGALRLDQVESVPKSTTPAPFPHLNDRAKGWLRFVWDKATTKDDWSSKGRPHEWWDHYTAPGVLSYPRFHLNESTYAVLMMADQTPAWREVYTRIMDELASRYPTYWGAVDWLTQIGDDPRRATYPPAIMSRLPEQLPGRYNRIGWVANGVAPYGLQPDPLGADGNLFFRGWFNLVLSAYRYVSGDDKWEKPFKVTGIRTASSFGATANRFAASRSKGPTPSASMGPSTRIDTKSSPGIAGNPRAVKSARTTSNLPPTRSPRPSHNARTLESPPSHLSHQRRPAWPTCPPVRAAGVEERATCVET